MSEAFLRTPKIGDEGRELFERKYAAGDKIVTSLLRVDTTLLRTRLNAPEMQLAELEDVARKHLSEALNFASRNQVANITDYFHLKIKHALIKQVVFAETAFSQRGKYELRRELANGAYGLVAEVLEEALVMYDEAREQDKDRLTGTINELTALALLNNKQVPERLAVPSEITADLYNATDLEFYKIRKDDNEDLPSSYHVQVKTSNQNRGKVEIALGGILITSEDMTNSFDGQERFPTSRAIVANVNATDTPEQEARLSSALEKLNLHMHESMTRSDEVFTILNNLPKELFDGVKKIARDVLNRALAENLAANEVYIDTSSPE